MTPRQGDSLARRFLSFSALSIPSFSRNGGLFMIGMITTPRQSRERYNFAPNPSFLGKALSSSLFVFLEIDWPQFLRAVLNI
jgi:hypothetical protein